MLYVFHVDTGTTMKFDMNLALESVGQLKEAIEKTYGIKCDKQVLLASGGGILESSARVCCYSAGTDTSPIFLFNMAFIGSSAPPSPSFDAFDDLDMAQIVENSMDLPASITTVTSRTQLAQQMCDQAKQLVRTCENLVHDQHLQQQGWSAVVANLDDICSISKLRLEGYDRSFKEYLDSIHEYSDILERFNDDLEKLGKIPILPALLEEEKRSRSEEGGEESEESSEGGEAMTLLQWISSKDTHHNLSQLADLCRKGLEQAHSSVIEDLLGEAKSALEAANTSDLREIKGLEERLFGLEQLKCEAKKCVQEQIDLAQAFLQNQARANNLNDPTILPVLCSYHQKQLALMLQNHEKLKDINRRCFKAKQELCGNLHSRLKWVSYVQSKISETVIKVDMFYDNTKRLRQQFEILRQVHLAPDVYFSAIAEVVRRRNFSQTFLSWANDLSCHVCAVHSEEVARRKDFQSSFEGHFLSSLFPGLEDSPPPYATQAPQLFDSKLPKLAIEDIEKLRAELPDLTLSLSVPDLTSINQFFLSRSVASNLKPEVANAAVSFDDKVVQVVTAVGLGSNLDPALLQPADNSQSSAQSGTNTQQTSDRGFESETDTEEFEKVGQSPSDIRVKTDLRGYLCIHRLNGTVEVITEIKSDMGELKQLVLRDRQEVHNLFVQVNAMCNEYNKRIMELNERASELDAMRHLNLEMESKLKQVIETEERERLQKEELKRRLCELEEEKEEALRKANSEVEAIRGRYRLYTRGLEMSVNESSICEKVDFIDRETHEKVLADVQKSLLEEKEKALLDERKKWEARLIQVKASTDREKQIIFNETLRNSMMFPDDPSDPSKKKPSKPSKSRSVVSLHSDPV